MFIFFKRNRHKATLPQGMTDIHSHLLPGVDDGIRTTEEAVTVMKYLQDIGVKRICLTPHIMEDLPNNTPQNLKSRFEKFKEAFPSGPELYLAAEYMLDAAFRKKTEADLLTMPNRHVLVETSSVSPPPELYNMLYDLALLDYIPVIAHPERYAYMDVQDYFKLKANGYKLQLNIFSLAGYYGLTPYKRAVNLLDSGLYDFVGTDIHRLKSFQEAMKALVMTRVQMEGIERLSENNDLLFR